MSTPTLPVSAKPIPIFEKIGPILWLVWHGILARTIYTVDLAENLLNFLSRYAIITLFITVLFTITGGSRTTEPFRRAVCVHCWRRPDFQTTQSWGEFVELVTTELWRRSGRVPTRMMSAAIGKTIAWRGKIPRRRLSSTMIQLKRRDPPGPQRDAFVRNPRHLPWSWDE